MSQPYDATLKYLVALSPAAWLEFVGLAPAPAEIVSEEELDDLLSADLSTVSAAADILMRLTGGGLAHIEFQSSPDPRMDIRVLRYNILAEYRFDQQVESVVVLLRREADHATTLGQVRRVHRSGEHYLAFTYRIMRLWQIPVEQILDGPFGILPTAPLADVTEELLPDIIREMSARISAEAQPAEAAEIWTSVYVLMGLKYSAALAKRLLQGVMGMEESTTYQEIVAKGEAIGVAKGEAQGIRETVLRIGAKRFGTPTDVAIAALQAIESLESLERLVDRLLEVESWDELLQAEK